MTQKTNLTAVAQAVALLGSRSSAAEAIGVSKSAVSMWCDGSSELPLLRAIQIDRLLGGAIQAEKLRPDAAAEFAYLRSSHARKGKHGRVASKHQELKRNGV